MGVEDTIKLEDELLVIDEELCTGCGICVKKCPFSAISVVNLPAPIGLGAGGGVGITMGSVNDVVALDLQLSAMETRGEGRVISQPKVMTLDNKEASITAGISIPFQIRQQGETSLSFIEANLNLTVTPHVTNDKSIVMVIEIAKNAPNTAIPTSTGDRPPPSSGRAKRIFLSRALPPVLRPRNGW